MSLRLKVECYAGYKADEKPRAFSLGNRWIQIEKIIDQWHGPDHTYSKVVGEDGHLYILKYHERDDHWELIFFKAGDSNLDVHPGMWKHTITS